MLSFPKPPRGEHVLDREAERYQRLCLERLAKAAAKRRDFWGCRWPQSDHKCRCGIEVAHMLDKSLGGSSETSNLLTLCAWQHRLGPQSIHSKDLKVEPETDQGADEACAFWRRDEHGIWVCVGVEVRIGVLRKL